MEVRGSFHEICASFHRSCGSFHFQTFHWLPRKLVVEGVGAFNISIYFHPRPLASTMSIYAYLLPFISSYFHQSSRLFHLLPCSSTYFTIVHLLSTTSIYFHQPPHTSNNFQSILPSYSMYYVHIFPLYCIYFHQLPFTPTSIHVVTSTRTFMLFHLHRR